MKRAVLGRGCFPYPTNTFGVFKINTSVFGVGHRSQFSARFRYLANPTTCNRGFGYLSYRKRGFCMHLVPAGLWEADFASLNKKYWNCVRNIAGQDPALAEQLLGVNELLGLRVCTLPRHAMSELSNLPALIFRPTSITSVQILVDLLGDTSKQSQSALESHLSSSTTSLPDEFLDLSNDLWRTVRDTMRQERVLSISRCQITPRLGDSIAALSTEHIDKLASYRGHTYKMRSPLIASKLVDLIALNASPAAIIKMRFSLLCAPSSMEQAA